MVSLTAAKTSRMFDVSVACVRLRKVSIGLRLWVAGHILGIQVEVGPVDLVEPPEEVLRCPVDIVSARIVREVVAERRSTQLLPEKIDLVQEEDDTGPREPSRVYHRVEKNQTLHHAVL